MKTTIRFFISTLSGGGAERVLVDLLDQLDCNTYDIKLVTVTGGVYESKLSPKIKYHKIVRFRNKKIEEIVSKIILKLPPKLFAKLFLRGKYDFEVAYLEGIPTRFVAGKLGETIKYAFVHCDLSKINMIAPFYKNNEEILDEYKSFTKVCFVSENSRIGFENAIGKLENGCVVHNVIDYKKIISLSQEPNNEEYKTGGIKFVTVGRLVEAKGFDRLLRIISDLEKEYDFELWIIGEGEERNNLEAIIHERNITSVRLLGFQENPYSLMKKADLFVCSSISEGYSTAVTEAVVMGIPVITTNCAGMDEILENGKYGLIVENSEEALKSVLRLLFLNKKFYLDTKKSVSLYGKSISPIQSLAEYTKLFNS